MLAFGCCAIVFGVWWAVVFRLFWPLAGSGVSSHCVWELTLSLCDDFEGFFVLDEERRLFTVRGSVCHCVNAGDRLVGHWRVSFLYTTLVMVSVISGQLLVFWLENETWLFLLLIFSTFKRSEALAPVWVRRVRVFLNVWMLEILAELNHLRWCIRTKFLTVVLLRVFMFGDFRWI